MGISVGRSNPSVSTVRRLIGSPSIGNVFYIPGCSGPRNVAFDSSIIHEVTTLGPTTRSFEVI